MVPKEEEDQKTIMKAEVINAKLAENATCRIQRCILTLRINMIYPLLEVGEEGEDLKKTLVSLFRTEPNSIL
jgi:hypothetical protein